MKLKEIYRTSTFAWSPSPDLPVLATGTVAGALDESFSNESQLEIWAPDFYDKNEYALGSQGNAGPKGSVTSSARFNRLAWGLDANRSRGIIAAGMENGELNIWDVEKILAGADQSESQILHNSTHTGPVRGLDFNPIQTNVFASGGVHGEIYIWNLQDLSKPYGPGSRSTKLDEVTSLAWNHQVGHVLATASTSGYTVVWDLRGKREVVALTYGGAPTGGPVGSMSGRRGMSDIAWHPGNATRLVTSSEDDSSPIIMSWDLRNARAPEKILTGHEKGVLSLSWCKEDHDLLLSCGKDNRVLCWNPQLPEVVGEIPSADNWAFQVDFCPNNPQIFAAAFFDGTVGIHSVQNTNENESSAATPVAEPQADGRDVFDNPSFARTNQATLSLTQPPKWLKRPVSATFGYGGQLVSIENLPAASGKNQSSVVHRRKVITEQSIITRASELQKAVEDGTLSEFVAKRLDAPDVQGKETAAGWRALLSLFKTDSRDELITLLGFSKAEIAKRVADAVSNLKASARPKSPIEEDTTEQKPFAQTVVSFAEPEPSPEPEPEPSAEATPSEMSASATSDATGGTQVADGESTTTAPSLFGDEAVGTPQTDAAADFFSSMGITGSGQQQMDVPHHNYPVDSSVAATIGSRPSSAMSEVKNNTFKIYPTDESETDRLVTKALVLGDFESAVSLCLSTDRFADAILLAVKGGPELLARTQKEYFERRTTALPYLRLFQSIVTNDLADIVQNADLQEWQEIFVVLCTFASQEEFASLTEQLGQRLEFQSSLAKASEAPEAGAFRKNATLTYLAAGRLERLVNIWLEELSDEEKSVAADEEHAHESRYSAHAHALQTFIEKVTVFRSAIKYVDADLSQQTAVNADAANAKSYKLSGLYDRYFEYADLLAAQGLVKEAVSFLQLTPSDYTGALGSQVDFKSARERLLAAAGLAATPAPAPAAAVRTAVPPAPGPAYNGYSAYAPPVPPVQQGGFAPNPPNMYTPANVAPTQNFTGVTHYGSNVPGPQLTTPAGGFVPAAGPYAPMNPYNPAAPISQQPQPGPGMLPPPQQQPPAPLPPPPPKRPVGGWNDAPVVPSRSPANVGGQKPNAITSPFPGAPPSLVSGSPTVSSGPSQGLPPPPRGGSAQLRQPSGPPPPGQRPPSIPPQGSAGAQGHLPPPPPRGGTSQHGPPGGPGARPPPGPGSQFGPPPPRGPSSLNPRATPPPGSQFARATPPPAGTQSGPYAPPVPVGGQPGPYGPPPGAQPGPYGPPPTQGAPPSSGMYGPPPGQAAPGPYGPPPGAQNQGPPGPPGGPAQGIPPPPPPGGPATGPPRSQSVAKPPAKTGPPPPKYPPGDRSHIPESERPIFNIISGQLEQLKQSTPPQQKRFVDDLERRINPLFDALNCETLSKGVIEQLGALSQAMAAHDRPAATALHVQLLTTGSLTDDIGLWMSGIKQLIMRL